MIGLLVALIGTLLGAVLALVPALHVCNVTGLLLLPTLRAGDWLAPEHQAMLFLRMIVGYAVLNTIPSVFLAVPDDSAVFVVLPAQKYLLQRRGYEAAVLTAPGGLGGLLFLLALTPVASSLFFFCARPAPRARWAGLDDQHGLFSLYAGRFPAGGGDLRGAGVLAAALAGPAGGPLGRPGGHALAFGRDAGPAGGRRAGFYRLGRAGGGGRDRPDPGDVGLPLDEMHGGLAAADHVKHVGRGARGCGLAGSGVDWVAY